MDKKTKLKSKKIAGLRGWIQAVATLLTNIHIPNLFKGKIYQGAAKNVCVPGLNCYSCPAATGACPIGAVQAVIGSSKFKFTYYITGFFILLGVLLGRFICGFLCPFGWFQDLLHKIPGKKFSTEKLKPLRYLKYIILLVFVILLPIFVTNSIGMGDPFFCKYICPQGVLEGAIPLSLGNAAIRSALGKLFSFKLIILITVIMELAALSLQMDWYRMQYPVIFPAMKKVKSRSYLQPARNVHLVTSISIRPIHTKRQVIPGRVTQQDIVLVRKGMRTHLYVHQILTQTVRSQELKMYL